MTSPVQPFKKQDKEEKRRAGDRGQYTKERRIGVPPTLQSELVYVGTAKSSPVGLWSIVGRWFLLVHMLRRSVRRCPEVTLLTIQVMELLIVHGLREWLARLGLDGPPTHFLFHHRGLLRWWR